MTNKEIIEKLFVALSAVVSMKTSNLQEQELQRECNDILYSGMTAPLQKHGLDNNLFYVSKNGFAPTMKGWNTLNPKPVVQNIPINVRRMSEEQLIQSTMDAMNETCFRAGKNGFPNFPKKLMAVLPEFLDKYNCLNDALASLLPKEEVKEEKAKKKRASKKA